MPPAAPIILAVLCLTASFVSGQRGGNYVDEYGDYDSPAPPPRVASRPLPRPSASASVAAAPRPTPVPILKQINRHNEDGSYTYGYEGADGSFKIETKLPNGEVMGKYGYVDDLGKVRVVEYGANKYGFQPAGEGITIPPPTLVDETKTRKGPQGQTVQYVDDGQYYPEEEPEIAQAPLRPAPRPAPAPAPRPKAVPRPQLSFDEYELEPVRPQAHAAPAPPRPVFANAAPVQPAPQRSVPRPQIFDSPRPRPAYQSAPAPRAQPVFSNAAPLSRPQIFQDSPAPRAQVFRPAPVYEEAPAPRPAPQRIPVPRSNSGGGGILDQLARDYALPQGGASVADISFGSY